MPGVYLHLAAFRVFSTYPHVMFFTLTKKERTRYANHNSLLHHNQKKTGDDVTIRKDTANLYELIHSSGIEISDIRYLKIQNHNFPICCPICKKEMQVKDSKRRYIKDETGRKVPFNLRRFRCETCIRLHIELPDLVFPYSQYDTATIERVRSGDYATFGGDDSTIRWWRKK